MGYNSKASILVKNNFPFEVRSIELEHKYSDDAKSSKIWNSVAAGVTTSDPLEAGYNTGFIRNGQDYWRIIVTLPDSVLWESDWHQCTLESKDNGKILIFEVDTSKFAMNLPSGSCSTSMSGNNNYNSLSVISILNEFPVKARVKLDHQYSNDKVYSHTWKNAIAPSSNSDSDDLFIVYYNTGFGRVGSDHWNIEVTLDVPPYDNQPQKAFQPWKNSTNNKQCELQFEDINKVITFKIRGQDWKMDLPSGSCTDDWKTPNGYNTTAFIEIKNNFSVGINNVLLTHQYSNDTTYIQNRANIPSGNSSAILMFVEYNTGGFRVGYDYWNVTVELVNGKIYKNTTEDKRCYMTSDDATGKLTFKVSDSEFYIGLNSGSCKNGMKFEKITDLYLGRDIKKKYNENAYLASHNSFANFDNGFYYAQQSMSIREQLSSGVSCLLLDIWDYKSDVYLIHYTAWLQPFAQPAKLVEGLEEVADYLKLNTDAVTTIIFEDKVTKNRSKIKSSFKQVKIGNVSLWDMIFFADKINKGWDLATQGWPTLEWLINNNLRLVVFSSKADPFPNQWTYMSENVYGDDSLNQSTWLNKRSESLPLDKKALCALNHFPTFAPSFISDWLTSLLSSIDKTNVEATAIKMFQECQQKWGRLPNYFQVDFFERPNMDTASAVIKLNLMLHGKPIPKRLLSSSRLLGNDYSLSSYKEIQRPILLTKWKEISAWLEVNNSELVTDEKSNQSVPSLTQLCQKLIISGDYALLLYSLLKTCRDTYDSQAGDDIKSWATRQAIMLADRLRAIDEKIDWLSIDEDTLLSTEILRALLPMALMAEVTGQYYEGVQHINAKLKSNVAAIERLNAIDDNLDVSFLLQLLVSGEAQPINWNVHIQRTIDALSQSESNHGRTTLLYRLTHEVFYSTKFGNQQLSQEITETLQQLLSNNAVSQISEGHRDLGAELLAGYWCIGGKMTPFVLEKIVIPITKHQLQSEPPSECCKSCEAKSDKLRKSKLASLDQSILLRTHHEVITTALALGLTLNLNNDQ